MQNSLQSHVKTKKLKDGQPNYNWSQICIRILTNPIYIGTVINGKREYERYVGKSATKKPKEEWYVSERPEFRICIGPEQF